MGRSRAAAKAAGSRTERETADTLAKYVDDRIDRRVKTGAKDKGDIASLRHHGRRVVVECKNEAKMNLAGWVTEAEAERLNDTDANGVPALYAIVVHNRVGKGDPLDSYVTMTLRDYIALHTGVRPGHIPEKVSDSA